MSTPPEMAIGRTERASNKAREGDRRGKVLQLDLKVRMQSFCRLCGVAVTWLRGIPFEHEIDHRIRCVGIDVTSRRKHADAAHEKAVRLFLRRAGRAGNRGSHSN